MTFDDWFEAFAETTIGTPIELSDIKEAWEAGYKLGLDIGRLQGAALMRMRENE